MSKVQSLYDFTKVKIPEILFELSISPQKIEEKLQAVKERFRTIEMVTDPILNHDIVEVLLMAEKRETIKIQINVGKGFFDREAEQQLLGRKTGERLSVIYQGDMWQLIIGQIYRFSYPEVSDDLIKRIGLSGVETIDAYRRYLIEGVAEEVKWKKLNGIINLVWKEVLDKSEFEGLSEDTADIKKYQVGLELAERNGVSYNQADYERTIEEYIESGQLTEQEIPEEFTYTDYLREAYTEYYEQSVIKYYDTWFKTILA